MSKPTDEWGTPQWLFDILDWEFHFLLDACASKINFKKPHYHNAEQNGLVRHWAERNWCNPPYSNQLPWVQKAIYERNMFSGTSVLLMKYDPSTKHGGLAAEEADEIRIIEHRLTFEGATNCANFPSAIAVFRPRLYTKKTQARILYVNYKEIMK